MQFSSLSSFLSTHGHVLANGPNALIFCEDDVECASTIDHHIKSGFRNIIVFAPVFISITDGPNIYVIDYDPTAEHITENCVNACLPYAKGQWLFYCYNAEYLFFPFSETRNVVELLAFHSEEKRDAMLTYVIDVYADDLSKFPNAVSRSNAYLDKAGYYALGRKDPVTFENVDRQMDFFGGLKWRFEEFIPYEKRKIDRIALFKAKDNLSLRPNHTLSDEEYNTYSCPWHHNLTAALISFRTAKALTRNPTSRSQISTFSWHNSVPFSWTSQQLLDLGLIETGQWF